MNKIIGYKIKDSAFKKWIESAGEVSHICTVQEYLTYNIGLPIGVYSEYLDKHNIDYIKDFKVSQEKGELICTKIFMNWSSSLNVKLDE